MGDTLLLWLPLAALIVLFASGAGLTTLLAGRLPRDAQFALAAPLGAAVMVCASAALHLGAPIRALSVAALSVSIGVTALRGRRVLRLLQGALVPLLVLGIALAAVAVPLASRGDWGAATVDNSDPYLWVSQARSFLDGPPPNPAAEHPDRIAYERVDDLSWRVGLPYGVAQLALLGGGVDPAHVYGAFAVVLAVLLALSVFAVARGCLEWPPWLAAVSACAVALNAVVLYSTFNGWQAQIALTLFGLLSIFSLRLALEPGSSAREQVLCGLFAAAAAGTYGVPFLFFAALMAVTIVAYVLTHRPVHWRRVGRVVGGAAGAAIVLGLLPFAQLIRQLTGPGGTSESVAWAGYARGLPPEAIGLIPRIGTPVRPPFGWTILASVTAIALLAIAVWPGRGPQRGRDLLIGTSAAVLLVIFVLQLPAASPYLSLKVAGYGAPLITMLAVSGLAGRFRFARTRVAVFGVAACCYAVSVGVVYELTRLHLQTLAPFKPLAAELSSVPTDVSIGVALEDSWNQSWALYYLRERPLVVMDPTDYLTGFGYEGRELQKEPFEYVVDYATEDPLNWKAADLVILRTAPEPGEESAVSFRRAGRGRNPGP